MPLLRPHASLPWTLLVVVDNATMPLKPLFTPFCHFAFGIFLDHSLCSCRKIWINLKAWLTLFVVVLWWYHLSAKPCFGKTRHRQEEGERVEKCDGNQTGGREEGEGARKWHLPSRGQVAWRPPSSGTAVVSGAARHPAFCLFSRATAEKYKLGARHAQYFSTKNVHNQLPQPWGASEKGVYEHNFVFDHYLHFSEYILGFPPCNMQMQCLSVDLGTERGTRFFLCSPKILCKQVGFL